MWKIWWAPNNASRWQMGFNSAFKMLNVSCFDVPFPRKTSNTSVRRFPWFLCASWETVLKLKIKIRKQNSNYYKYLSNIIPFCWLIISDPIQSKRTQRSNTMRCFIVTNVTTNLKHTETQNIHFFCGAATQHGSWPPHSRGFQITHNDAPQSVGPLWTSDHPVAETSTCQHTTLTTNIHAPGGIRTHDLSRRTAVDLRLRPRGHWDRHKIYMHYNIL